MPLCVMRARVFFFSNAHIFRVQEKSVSSAFSALCRVACISASVSTVQNTCKMLRAHRKKWRKKMHDNKNCETNKRLEKVSSHVSGLCFYLSLSFIEIVLSENTGIMNFNVN